MLKSFGLLPVATALVGLGVVAFASHVRAGGDKVVFPEGFDKGVLYHDGRSRRQQAIPRALHQPGGGRGRQEGPAAAERHGHHDGAVEGQARRRRAIRKKDANGRFIKGDLIGYTVMEKRNGWGTEYPDTLRNGEWEYQAFTAAKAVNATAKLNACFECHLPKKSDDYVFLYGKMAGK